MCKLPLPSLIQQISLPHHPAKPSQNTCMKKGVGGEKRKTQADFFKKSESKHSGHGGLEVMGKEEIIGLIGQAHTSLPEINQKSLLCRTPLS